jgi:hypothetical protein
MADVSARVQQFRTELKQDRIKYLRLGRWNYRAAYALTILTVLSSAAAGILGLGWQVDHRIVSLLALVPAIAVTVSSQFKWQDKANWHYQKSEAAKALLRRIDYELPDHPTASQLTDLSRGYSVTDAEMSEAWKGMSFAAASCGPEMDSAGVDAAAAPAADGGND